MVRRFIATFIANAIAFFLAGYFITNFTINFDLESFALLILVFTVINLLIRPIVKFVLTPFIIVTLGLFNLVITGGFLYIIDIYSENITISSTTALIYGTLIITIVNLVLHTRSSKPTQF